MSTGSELYDLLAKTNATLNPNNTITLRFNDGSSYTTGVIKDGPELSPADKAMEEAKEASTISQAAMEEASKAAVAAGNAEQSASEAAASATNAENFASEAQQSASAASTAATNAETSAGNAATSANNAATSAQAAATSADAAESEAQRAASEANEAKTQAGEAKTQAANASEYASRALGNLSTVQSVTETLNWITAHGTMTQTTDTELDPSHVYFILDPNGDYTVSGNKYSVVTEPKVADIATYYELSIDESLNNYVATHLAVDSEGLWILPDSGGNKVLIATGQGSTYSSAGTYIVSGSDILAEFTANGAQIGPDNKSNITISSNSFRLHPGAWVPGVSSVVIGDKYTEETTETQVADGVAVVYFLQTPIDASTATSENVQVEIDDVLQEFGVDYVVDDWNARGHLTFTTAPSSGSVIKATYICSRDWPYFIFGVSPTAVIKELGYNSATFGNSKATGKYSFASGVDVVASGKSSHAEGENTKAIGTDSHAEGSGTTAGGSQSHAEGNGTTAEALASHAEGKETIAEAWYSHAQNLGTIAAKQGQTTLGTYNTEDTATTTTTHPSNYLEYGKYAVIVGNGYKSNDVEHRSNALTVDWQGDVWAAGSVTENNGTRDIDLNISEATIALYDALAGGTSWRE